MTFKARPARRPEPALKQAPKPSVPCMPRVAVAALVIVGTLLAVLFA